MSDRTVHAKYEGMEIVRYDRAGKWYLEPTVPSLKRQHVSIREAASNAVRGLDHGGDWFAGLSGGSRFDRMVRDQT